VVLLDASAVRGTKGPWAVIMLITVLALSSLVQPSDFSTSTPGTGTRAGAQAGPYLETGYQTVGQVSPVQIPSNQFYLLGATSYGGSTTMKFAVNASASLDIYVVNETQFIIFFLSYIFSVPLSPANFSVYHVAGARVSAEVPLPSEGEYFLVLFNDISRRTAYAEIAYTPGPVYIYSHYSSRPAPVGITDYGIQNSSGAVTPYEEEISQVTGNAVVNQVKVLSDQLANFTLPPSASLQLNAMLRVNTTSGQYDYWLQDVAQLFPANNTMAFVDNLWNSSAILAPVDQEYLSGAGSVHAIGPPLNESFYAERTALFRYALPETLRLTMAVSHTAQAVKVGFGYMMASKGGRVPSAPVIFDNLTITEPQAINDAAIIVNGNEGTPGGDFFDAELVFGGGSSGASATFLKLDSVLNMDYVLANGSAARPTSLYLFGSNTGEVSSNLQVTRVSSGFHVGTGLVDFGQSYSPSASFTSVTCDPASVLIGHSTTCVATVTGADPTGIVTFSSSSGTFSSRNSTASTLSCALVKGSCSLRFKPSSAESSANVTASYRGDAANLGSSGALKLNVAKKASLTSIACSTASAKAGAPITCTAKVTGYFLGGTVSWSQSGGTGSLLLPSDSCTLVKGRCSITLDGTAAGTVVLQAAYGGDADNTGSVATFTLTIK